MLTVGSLVADCGLELSAGADGADRPIRWVHISELEDPTPWLSGGELLLTTGIQLKGAARQRRFLARLAEREVAGLGVGTGFEHKRLPKPLVEEAEARGMPVFEVPYEMPFIAITERAFAMLVNEQYAILERGAQVHERLERLVIEGRGLEAILGSLASAIGGSAIVQDATGRELARHSGKGVPGAAALKALSAEAAARRVTSALTPFEPKHSSLTGRALAVPVPGRRGGAPVAWLIVVSQRDPLGDFERLTARQGSIVVGLELMRERVVRETERRLAGDLLAEALSGRLDSDELRGRLRPFGIGAEAAVLVFDLEDPHAGEQALELELANAGVPALVATSAAASRPLLCAVIDGRSGDPVEIAGGVRSALAGSHGQVRAAASRCAGVGSLRRAFHEARCALEATSLADGDAPVVASHRDLGAFTLLLSLQDEDALRLYSDGLLEPIERTEGEYGGELLRSLEAYIEHNGNWERAARQLYCHRHTLRYRIRKIEELTGRDLSRATDRIELWLALRARELVG
jgi:purine catabolism regulatory family protein/PucR-like helix-turn-helix protein/diguanylate cyclase with GGDEF domain